MSFLFLPAGFTIYMTRRPSLLLENSVTGEIHLKSGPGFFMHFNPKNEHNSKSVNSFDSGPIFRPTLGQDLSRNGFVVSVYAF